MGRPLDTSAESFEDHMARESREEARLVDDFVSKLESLDLPGWEFDASGTCPRFTHAESGAAFFVTLPGDWCSRNGKVEAIAAWPKSQDGKPCSFYDWGLERYDESGTYRIGFSYGKSAAAIARDLTRRLIPQLLEGMVKVNEKLALQSAALDTINHDVGKLRVAFDTSDVRDRSYYAATVYFDRRGSARISTHNSDSKGNRVDLRLSDLTIAQAILVAEILGLGAKEVF